MKTILTFILIWMSVAAFSQTPEYNVWVEKSMKFIQTDQLDSAAVALQKAMASDPANENNTLLLLNLGILQRQLQQYDNAYISFTASLNSSNNAPLVLHNRASLLVDLERYDEAMEDYNALLFNDPADTEAYYRRGLLFLEKNDRIRAEADFAAANRVNPNDLYTKLSMALLYKLDNNWTEAEKVYTDIIVSETDANPVYFLNRAECYLNTGQTAHAAADLNVIERKQRQNPYFYILRGRLRLEQYDKSAAKADFEKAKELGYDVQIADVWMKKAQ